MKRILICTNHFYPETFRCNDVAFELAKRGYEVTVLSAYWARRSFLVKSDMRSSNLGTASIALSKVLLGMVYCGAGE